MQLNTHNERGPYESRVAALDEGKMWTREDGPRDRPMFVYRKPGASDWYPDWYLSTTPPDDAVWVFRVKMGIVQELSGPDEPLKKRAKKRAPKAKKSAPKAKLAKLVVKPLRLKTAIKLPRR